MCHEAGHVLGLAHVDTTNAVMYEDSNGRAETPTSVDRANLIDLYGN